MTDQRAFMNRLRSLFNVDWVQLPELSEGDWGRFMPDPVRFLMRAPDFQADAIWREIEKRQPKAEPIDAGLLSILSSLVDAFGCSIEQYHKLGPDWTMKDGTETFNVSVLLDREELIEKARAAIERAEGHSK